MLHNSTVHPATLELLKGISDIPELNHFVLAGGTALALQIGHRISYDLDFFGKSDSFGEQILESLKIFQPVSILNQKKHILSLMVKNVKVDFVNYSYSLISEPIIFDNIRLTGLPDIAAMKLSAICGRGRKRDFCDLFFLLKSFSLKQMMEFYRSKFSDGSEFLVTRSLTYFEDAEEDEELVFVNEKPTWGEVKNRLKTEINNFYK